MNNDVVEVQLRSVVPLDGAFAVFLGTDEKTMVIYVDEPVGTAIAMSMRGVVKDRPLTHDLMGHMLRAFGAKVERVVINHMDNSVYHARLILSAENELHHRKVVELDARPSDSIALAVAQNAPIFVSQPVWAAADDNSDSLANLEQLRHTRGRKREGEK
jgi:bifunctional DNase/RNase